MKLLVKNLSFKAKYKEVVKIFEGYGSARIEILKDHATGRPLGQAIVDMADDDKAREAIRRLDGMEHLGRKIRLSPVEDEASSYPQAARRPADAQRGAGGGTMTTVSPYRFIERKAFREPLKKPLDVYHNKLEADRLDVAFEIGWTTLTPTALNPCTGVEDELKGRFKYNRLPASMPEKEGEYAGYNRRWLTIGNRLAISPFTVKSAVAHGFANILGSCYRVNSKKAPHQKFDEGQYPYIGCFKRYRVAMDHSKPGLLTSVKESVDPKGRKGYEVEVQAVKEYYYEKDSKFVPGQSYDAHWYHPPKRDREGNPIDAEDKKKKCLDFGGPAGSGNNAVKVIYYGPYKFGMNAELQFPDLDKTHQHRFYEKDAAIGILKGFIPEENFLSKDGMAKLVYMGNFKTLHGNDPRKKRSLTGEYWYDNLENLRNQCKKGEKLWVYYEAFDVINPKTGTPLVDPATNKTARQIAHIGQNYQFKALFLHDDAVPEGYEACCKVSEPLCPRCRMFGMTEEGDIEKREGGLRGRFKAAALFMKEEIRPETDQINIRYLENGRPVMKPIDTVQWKRVSDNQAIARQVLLPIQGPPKPNKRDIEGYFNPVTGRLKGAKAYEDGAGKSLAEFINETDGKWKTENRTGEVKFEYAHHLRNYAVVCETGCTFQGVVGAENCDIEEIVALFVLLESGIANHGFRLGQGKAFGLGSVESHIKRMWIRKGINKESKDAEGNGAAYDWTPVDLSACQTADAKIGEVEKLVAGLRKVKEDLCTAQNIAARMNTLDRAKQFKSFYANPTVRSHGPYWETFNANRKKHGT